MYLKLLIEQYYIFRYSFSMKRISPRQVKYERLGSLSVEEVKEVVKMLSKKLEQQPSYKDEDANKRVF